MIAFASNSLLCRAALKQTTVDAATFTFRPRFLRRRRALAHRDDAPRFWSGGQSSHSWQLAIRARSSLHMPLPFHLHMSIFISWNGRVAFCLAQVQATMILWGLYKGER